MFKPITNNAARTAAREELRAIIVDVFSRLTAEQVIERLEAAPIAHVDWLTTLPPTRLPRQALPDDAGFGLHFLQPVPKVPLVEVVRGMRTSDSTIAAVRGLSENLGKVPIDVKIGRAHV